MPRGEGPTNFIFTTLSLLDGENFAVQKEWTEALDKLLDHDDCWQMWYSPGLDDPEHMYLLTEWRLAFGDVTQRTAFAWTGLESMLTTEPQSELLFLTSGHIFPGFDQVHEVIIVRGDHRVAEANLMDSLMGAYWAAMPPCIPQVYPEHLLGFLQGEFKPDELSCKYAVVCRWVSMDGMRAFKDPNKDTFDKPDDWQSRFENKLTSLRALGATVESHMLQFKYWPS